MSLPSFTQVNLFCSQCMPTVCVADAVLSIASKDEVGVSLQSMQLLCIEVNHINCRARWPPPSEIYQLFITKYYLLLATTMDLSIQVVRTHTSPTLPPTNFFLLIVH